MLMVPSITSFCASQFLHVPYSGQGQCCIVRESMQAVFSKVKGHALPYGLSLIRAIVVKAPISVGKCNSDVILHPRRAIGGCPTFYAPATLALIDNLLLDHSVPPLSNTPTPGGDSIEAKYLRNRQVQNMHLADA